MLPFAFALPLPRLALLVAKTLLSFALLFVVAFRLFAMQIVVAAEEVAAMPVAIASPLIVVLNFLGLLAFLPLTGRSRSASSGDGLGFWA